MACSCPPSLQDERFLLLGTLGRGGMGTVYRAFDRSEERLVALKVATGNEPAGPSHPLATEFELWSRLVHPHIVRAYEMAHATRGPVRAGAPYLVLECVAGRPVNRSLRTGRVSARAAEELATQVLSALAHVHATGWVHGDVKPGNVLVEPTREGEGGGGGGLRYVVTDFGLAGPEGASGRLGTFAGSLPYVAPEAVLGFPLDGRADLYGLGLLLYHVLTGELPGPVGDPAELLHWHLDGPPVDPGDARPSLSPRLRRFVRRLTVRDREGRPASALHALELLGRRAVEPRDRPAPRGPSAELAGLRLALDAARLGARRLFRLPPSRPAAESLVRELRVWCQVRGLAVWPLAGDVERLVLRLAGAWGPEGAALVRRLGLARWLALDLVGDAVLPDPSRRPPGDPTAEAALAALGTFLQACSEHRPFVLDARCCERERELAKRLRARLIYELEGAGRASPAGACGLLVVVDAEEQTAVPTQRGQAQSGISPSTAGCLAKADAERCVRSAWCSRTRRASAGP